MQFRKTITLIGFQASGKTTLGQMLANELQCTFMDTDRMIEKYHPPLPCRTIHNNFGEIYFRDLESLVIASLNYQTPFVLATGGGSLLQNKNAILLQENSVLIYLKTSAEILKERIWKEASLPSYLLANDPHDDFHLIYQKRVVIYEKWAQHIIHMDGLPLHEALQSILRILYCIEE